MKTIEQIRELVDKARKVQNDSIGLYRSFQDTYKQEQAKIMQNNDYTREGKQKLIASLQKRKTIELLKLARSQRNLFDSYLKEAKQAAESIIYAKTPKVDPEKEERFNKRLQEVKTEIMLSNPKTGKEILAKFLETIDEQAFAAKIKDDFVNIIQPILANAGQEAGKYRYELLQIFEETKTRSMHPEAKEAMQIVEYVDAAMNGSFFIPLVEEKVKEHFGETAAKYINKPDEYFEEHPEDDKPLTNLRTTEEILEEEEAKIQ
jgi:ribosomal protein L7/L12